MRKFRLGLLLISAVVALAACDKSGAPKQSASKITTPLELAKKSNCMGCHIVDRKLVGPAYQDVAKKYAGQADAEATLIAKIKAGGKGVWGEIPMPPNSTIREEDIRTLVKWILAGAT